MKHIAERPSAGFEVLAGTSRSQAATMVLEAGEATGGPDNRHDAADQWIFVVSGTGKAIVEGQTVALAPGSLLLIEPGEGHEISSTGSDALDMITIYSPPEY